MARTILTDEQVEAEIERLRFSPHVQLARKEMRVKYQRRQYLYTLRNLEKRGKELEKSGIDFDILDSVAEDAEDFGC